MYASQLFLNGMHVFAPPQSEDSDLFLLPLNLGSGDIVNGSPSLEPLKFSKYGNSEISILDLAFQLDLQQKRRKMRKEELLEREEEDELSMMLEPSLDDLSDSPLHGDLSDMNSLTRNRSREVKGNRPLIRRKDGNGFGKEQDYSSLDFVNEPIPQSSLERQPSEDEGTKSGKPKRKRESSDRKRIRKPSEKEQVPITFDQVPWIPFEDDIIIRGVKMFGENWSLITEILNSSSFIFRDRRTRAQCHARFHSHLKASLETSASEFDKNADKSKKNRSVVKPPRTSACILEIMKRKARDLTRVDTTTTPDNRSIHTLATLNHPMLLEAKSPATLLNELRQQRLKQAESRPKQLDDPIANPLPIFHPDAIELTKKPTVILPAVPLRKVSVTPAPIPVEDPSKPSSTPLPTTVIPSRPTQRGALLYPNTEPRSIYTPTPSSTDPNIMHTASSSPAHTEPVLYSASSSSSAPHSASEMVFGPYPGKPIPAKKTPSSTTRIPRSSKSQTPSRSSKDTYSSGIQTTIPMSFHTVSNSEYISNTLPRPTLSSSEQTPPFPHHATTLPTAHPSSSSSSASSSSSSYSINEHYIVHPSPPSSSQPSWNPSQGSGYNMYSE